MDDNPLRLCQWNRLSFSVIFFHTLMSSQLNNIESSATRQVLAGDSAKSCNKQKYASDCARL